MKPLDLNRIKRGISAKCTYTGSLRMGMSAFKLPSVSDERRKKIWKKELGKRPM